MKVNYFRYASRETYFDTLVKLKQAIKVKRPRKLASQVVLLHNNAQPHTAALTQSLLKDFKRGHIPPPSILPGHCSFQLPYISGLKKDLGGRQFVHKESLKKVVIDYFAKQDDAWYAAGIEKLIPGYDKCLEKYGDYVEK